MRKLEGFHPYFLHDARARLRGERRGPPYYCPWCGQVFVLSSDLWLIHGDRTDCSSAACGFTGSKNRAAYRKLVPQVPTLRTVVGWMRELENPDAAHLVSEAILGHPFYGWVVEQLSEPDGAELPPPPA